MKDTDNKRYRLLKDISMPYKSIKAGTVGVEIAPSGYVSFGEGTNSLAYSIKDIEKQPEWFEPIPEPPLSKEQSIPEKMEIQKGLQHGFYIIHWVTGGFSYASIGYTHDGTNWFAPCNWTCESNDKPMVASTDWSKVKQIELVKNYNYANPIEKLICIEQSEVASYDGVYFKTKQGARLYTKQEVDDMIKEACKEKDNGLSLPDDYIDDMGRLKIQFANGEKKSVEELIKEFNSQPLAFYSPPKRYSQSEVDAIREELGFAICYLKAFVDLNKGGIKADETSKDAQKIIDNYEAKHKPLTKDKEVDTGKDVIRQSSFYEKDMVGQWQSADKDFTKAQLDHLNTNDTGKDSKEWEIISVRWVFNNPDLKDFVINKTNGMWRLDLGKECVLTDEQILKNECIKIYSVKRLSDNEVFTIGDKIGWGTDGSYETTLTGFEIVDGRLKIDDSQRPKYCGKSDFLNAYKLHKKPSNPRPQSI